MIVGAAIAVFVVVAARVRGATRTKTATFKKTVKVFQTKE